MATIAPIGKYILTDGNGDPLSGGKVYTYDAGTSTPKATFTTQDESVANANPVVLDGNGFADIWLGDGGYKFTVTDANDVTLFTVDDIGGGSSAAFGGDVNTLSANTPITDLYANSVNIATQALTLSLLSASIAGEGFYFSLKNTGTGSVTIDPDGAETINGSATVDLEPNKSALIICDGSQWYTIFSTLDINSLTTYADIADQSDFLPLYDLSAKEEKKLTVRNLFATIDDISNFGDSPAIDDKLAIVNVSNGNANSIVYGDLMNISNLTEDVSPDLENDFLLIYDTSAGEAKKTKAGKISAISGVATATTSGTAFDFTAIPSTAKQITVNFEDVSTSGSDNLLIQIGDSGGVETSGYVSGCSDSGGDVSSTAGFIIKCNSAGNNVSGTLVLNLLDASTNTWVASGALNVSSISPRLLVVAGDKSLSATLDRVRLTRTGADTFDNGKININYI